MAENLSRILIVDDERPIRRFLSDSLDEQYAIFEAANGKDAIRAAASERPDLIILDLGLPDIDGVEVTRRLRGSWPKCARRALPKSLYKSPAPARCQSPGLGAGHGKTYRTHAPDRLREFPSHDLSR